MKSISVLALTLGLAAATLASAPAEAQRRGKKDAAAVPAVDPNARVYKFSKNARPLIGALQTAVTAKDAAAYGTALAAAQAAATTPDDRYAVGQLQLQYAIGTQNVPAQLAAIEALVASGGATQAELPRLYRNIAGLAYDAKDYDKAAFGYERVLALEPGNADILISLGELRNRQGKTAEGIALIERAIAARTAAGQPVDENWYKRAVSLSYNAKAMPQAFRLTRAWLTAYPTDKNWRDALVDHQQLVPLDNAGDLDRLRLMRAARALHGERAYGEYADIAFQAGLPGEAQRVLEEGIAAKVVDGNKATYKDLLARSRSGAVRDRPTLAGGEAKATASATGKLSQNQADAYLSYGDNAKAVTFYRAALAKGGVDADIVNTRLGIALAMTGDKAGASTAFNAVKGVRSDLAQYWVLWLGKSA